MKKSHRKPIAYLLVGFISSGKTTFAKKLEKETGALRFTKDEWIIRIFGNDPNFAEFNTYDERITALARDIAFQCLRAGNDVIIDEGFWMRAQRDDLRKRIKQAGAICQIYYIKCSDKTMKQRLVKRNKKLTKDAFYIDETMFNSYKKYFEAPGRDEDCHVIENDKS
jgi:predicted kinase